MKVLLIDDDQELCQLLQQYLAKEEIDAQLCHTGDQGLQQALEGNFDAIILDIMMPVMDGLQVLTELRKKSNVPVLMLTAKGDEMDRITGLEIGADDYLPKPCNPRELLARLRAVLRRGHDLVATETATTSSKIIEVDDIQIDHDLHQVERQGELLDLTVTEYSILTVLLQARGKVIEKNDLAEKAMSRPLTLFDRSLDMHLSNLRKKLGAHPDGSARIKTVRGVGYMYIEASAS